MAGNHLGAIPWNLETALSVVEAKTSGAFVCMGRGTQGEIESRIKAVRRHGGDRGFLHQSMNVVISSQDGLRCPGCVQAFSRDDALQFASRREMDRIFVIGGPHLYDEFLPFADNLFVIQSLSSDKQDQDIPHALGLFQSTTRVTKVYEEQSQRIRFAEYARRS